MTTTVEPPTLVRVDVDAAPARPADRRARPAQPRRLMGVDAGRGVALLGMMAVHSLYTADAAGRPTWSAEIFSGRASAAFAVLAGIGVAFLTGRQRVPLPGSLPTVAALAVRALVVGAFGLALGYTSAELAQVILPYYAVMFALVIPLVFLPTWTVAVLGAAVAVGMPVLSAVLRPHLPEPSLENPTFRYLIEHPAGLLTELSITGVYPALPWLAYLCAGLVIGRLDLTSRKVATILLTTGTALAVTASVISALLLRRYGGLTHIQAAQPDSGLTMPETADVLTFGGEGTAPTSTWWWLAVDAPHTGTPFDLLATTGAAVALLGVMLLAASLARPTLRRVTTVVQAPLAAAGSMTLTFYSAHVMFINSDFDTYDATTGYLLQVAAVLLLGLAWRTTVGRGPLEGIIAALTTDARQRCTTGRHRRPTRKSAGPAAASTATGNAAASATVGDAAASATVGNAAGDDTVGANSADSGGVPEKRE